MILAVDGDEVSTPSALQTAIDAKAPGDTLTLRIVRGGATRTVTVTLGTRPPERRGAGNACGEVTQGRVAPGSALERAPHPDPGRVRPLS